MIQIDTSVLVDALTGPRRSVPEVWTLSRGDFANIPELRLHDPRGRGRR